MKANKVKFWARLGQGVYFIHCIAYALFKIQLPNFIPTEFSGKVTEGIYLMIAFVGMIILSEVIVRLIGYFAELLEERK